MNREILFRGKREDNGEWIEGTLLKSSPQMKEYDCIVNCERVHKSFEAAYYHYEKIILDTVGQYTGLNDVNRKKIFEGDIVQTCDDKNPKTFVIKSKCGRLGYQYYLENIDGSEYKSYMPYAMRIIGNIHDNSELLEVE